jgi:hypothetical protein
MLRLLRFFVPVLMLVLPAAVFADEPDTVTLKNGDHITGSVRGLDRGTLRFGAAEGGSMEIPWGNVAQIKSSVRFEVELASGKRYYGTIASTGDHLEVKGAAAPVVLERKDVIRMTAIAGTFRQRTSVSLDFGFSLVSPPDPTTTYTLDAELLNRTHSFLTEATLNSLTARNEGNISEIRNFFDLNTRRILARRWFLIGQFEAQNDKDLNLDVRLLAGGGLGRTLAQSHENEFSAFGGFDYNRERYSDPHDLNNSAEALAGMDWKWFPSHSADLDTTAETFISLQRPRVRLEFNSELTDFVFRKLYWGLNVFESFDSDPPGNTHKESNFGTSITIGWKF